MPQMNGYIGRAPSDSTVLKARQVYNVTGATSTFTFASGYDVGFFEVYINGVKQVVNNDYTAGNGTTFTLATAAASGDVIEAVAYKAFNLAKISSIDTISGDLEVDSNLTVGGNISLGGTIFGDGSGLTGIARTHNVATDTLNVVGVSTIPVISGVTSIANVVVGGATTELIVNGDARVTGIFTVGTASITFDGITNEIRVGSGVTITNVGGADFVGMMTAGSLRVTDTTNSVSNTTGALVVTGGIGIGNSLHVGGDVFIEGSVTYEDVTNVDVVGLITARSGLHVGPIAGIAATLTPQGGAVFTGVTTMSNTTVGGGSTQLVVNGDATITGTVSFDISQLTSI